MHIYLYKNVDTKYISIDIDIYCNIIIVENKPGNNVYQ